MKSDIETKRLFKKANKLLDKAEGILKGIFEDCHKKYGNKKAA